MVFVKGKQVLVVLMLETTVACPTASTAHAHKLHDDVEACKAPAEEDAHQEHNDDDNSLHPK